MKLSEKEWLDQLYETCLLAKDTPRLQMRLIDNYYNSCDKVNPDNDYLFKKLYFIAEGWNPEEYLNSFKLGIIKDCYSIVNIPFTLQDTMPGADDYEIYKDILFNSPTYAKAYLFCKYLLATEQPEKLKTIASKYITAFGCYLEKELLYQYVQLLDYFK